MIITLATGIPGGSVATRGALSFGGADVDVARPVRPGVYVTEARVLQVGRTWSGVDVLQLDTFDGPVWFESQDCRATYYGWQHIRRALEAIA